MIGDRFTCIIPSEDGGTVLPVQTSKVAKLMWPAYLYNAEGGEVDVASFTCTLPRLTELMQPVLPVQYRGWRR